MQRRMKAEKKDMGISRWTDMNDESQWKLMTSVAGRAILENSESIHNKKDNTNIIYI